MPANSKPVRTKECNYCKYHGFKVPEKGHKGKCQYNNEKHKKGCDGCRKVAKKTEIAQEHRKRKIEAANVQQESATFRLGGEILVRPKLYPDKHFSQEDMMHFRQFLETDMDYENKKIQYCNGNAGMIAVTYLENSAADWIQQKIEMWIQSLNGNKSDFIIGPSDSSNNYIKLQCELKEQTTASEFLNLFSDQNRIISTKWRNLKIETYDGKYIVSFDVDPISAYLIKALEYRIRFKDEVICVEKCEGLEGHTQQVLPITEPGESSLADYLKNFDVEQPCIEEGHDQTTLAINPSNSHGDEIPHHINFNVPQSTPYQIMDYQCSTSENQIIQQQNPGDLNSADYQVLFNDSAGLSNTNLFDGIIDNDDRYPFMMSDSSDRLLSQSSTWNDSFSFDSDFKIL